MSNEVMLDGFPALWQSNTSDHELMWNPCFFVHDRPALTETYFLISVGDDLEEWKRVESTDLDFIPYCTKTGVSYHTRKENGYLIKEMCVPLKYME